MAPSRRLLKNVVLLGLGLVGSGFMRKTWASGRPVPANPAQAAGFGLGSDTEDDEPNRHGNELPDDVKSEIEEVSMRRDMAAMMEPASLPIFEFQLSHAKLRMQIATLRLKRDRLRKQKKTAEADEIDRRVHEAKARLAELKPSKALISQMAAEPHGPQLDE